MSANQSSEEDPIEQLLLTAYPNPERKGCPGGEILASLANKERDPKDPNWYHVWHCSPCYAEFKELRDARWGLEEQRAKQIKRRSWLAAAAGLTIIAGVGGWAFINHERRGAETFQTAQLTIDLSNVDATRGDGQDHTIKLRPLPRKLDDIKIILPRFSDEGEYQVAILTSKAADSAVAVAQGNTTKVGDQLLVSVRLDLSRVPESTYLLGTRLRGGNQIYYYPLRVQ